MMSVEILGSVSPYPKNSCNCNGCIVRGNTNILLDCGFGVSGELNLPEDLQSLVIIITHYHKDHYSDVFALEYASACYHNLGELENKVKLYLPLVRENEDGYDDHRLLANNESSYFDIKTYDQNTVLNINGSEITFFETYHSVINYSVRVVDKDKTLVYSGDMGYSNIEEYSEFCRNANLFICESTFLTSDNKESSVHLTATEAAAIASLSNAGKLVLTHMWPEHDKNEYITEARKVFSETYAAVEKDVYEL